MRVRNSLGGMFFAPKGRNMTAQGIALGNENGLRTKAL